MLTVYVMCGLSFAGKTTLARRIAASTASAVVSYDELYASVERDAVLTGLHEWEFIVSCMDDAVRAELAAERSVVVDNLNEDLVDRDRLRAIADDFGAKTIVIHVQAPLELIGERRRTNDATSARGTTSDEQFEFVRSKFEAPGPPECVVSYQAGDALEPWLAALLAHA